ncbi:MAG: hypothetical protein HY852_04770 [Bradyrhizobium sp.]|uniref:hypothetical protein n=1 Tax=Bradyrhizobium sp. TaxID=376 RepID=UPI0025BDA21E|nr:hypothetical protein [Bradyrhizobium sp.]MBI5261114.1 hypothetical protein [Bradyrhizobium sp.]
MPNSVFRKLTVAEVADRLQLESHFSFHDYDGDGRSVRHYAEDATIEGDIDLDRLFWGGIAGIWAERDLIVNGNIINWEIDTPACFLAIGRDLICRNLVASSADIRIGRDAKVAGVFSSTYNHGFIEVDRNAHAKYIIIDDHTTIVRGNAEARGWKDAEHVEIALPVSSWLEEVRPEFRAEFFKLDGRMICPNGNVDLVKALLAGREILRD